MASEKRLIDAHAYCRELYEERDYPGRTQEFMDAIEVAIAALWDMPTVDAVEVVRCKDCKHFDEHTKKCYVFCHDCIEVQLEVDGDHFVPTEKGKTMYKSPIDVIYGQMQTQMEGDILQAIRGYGINVDKDELLLALQYDRDQYSEGYTDGRSDAVAHGMWHKYMDYFTKRQTGWICTNCSSVTNDLSNGDTPFCPHCGAMMDLMDEEG